MTRLTKISGCHCLYLVHILEVSNVILTTIKEKIEMVYHISALCVYMNASDFKKLNSITLWNGEEARDLNSENNPKLEITACSKFCDSLPGMEDK